MADSLFDNRYRYDFIYPRGRSGETLRAIDTQNEDRPVVIKRPAPNDAPPIRAGQEVSILNERKALMRLAGHAVLTELVGSGQFFVGGVPHQYIAMERAQGAIIADLVLDYAARGERLPELEVLVIVDALLDLLHVAHSKDIVYNDVDAKHLFWDRQNYQLKVIDWGNAIFLEGDEMTPQGISRQSDIFQVGELLYFIFTGGRRVNIPHDVGEDFRLDFGDDAQRVHSRLQAIISRAVHPNLKIRYARIADLRADLAQHRAPLERDRNAVVARIEERLAREQLSKNELRALLATLEPSLDKDPGYPPARRAYEDLTGRLRDLDVSADLDAVRIYMERGNWGRAADLLNDLRDKTGAKTTSLVKLLLDCCILLTDSPVQPPYAVMDAISFLFEGQSHAAARALLRTPTNDEATRQLQWGLAERISSHMPEVLLLRPNLYRLSLALDQLAADGIRTDEPRALLKQIDVEIGIIESAKEANLRDLRDRFRAIVDQINALQRLLPTLAVQHNLSNRRLPLTSLDRALNAAMALADNMHVIGKQATRNPRDALAALESSRDIEPTNGIWDSLTDFLEELYQRLESCQTYVPAADGSDLADWLLETHRFLEPFVEQLFDELLVEIVEGLATAMSAWKAYGEAVLMGDRASAINALTRATDVVSFLSPTLAGWFNQLRNVISGTRYIERHALHGGLGRALADGWEAFDRSRLADAERLGQQAFEIARDEAGRNAAKRLRTLAQIARDWVERNGIASPSRTQAALTSVEALYSDLEQTTLQNFTAQMPSIETYLRAMSKGLIEVFNRRSTPALRILFINYVLLGTLDAHEGKLDDADFWREAAVKTLAEVGPRHVAALALDEFIARRRDLNSASALFNQLKGAHNIPHLEATRRQLEDNPQARLLVAGIQSLRELEAALRDWADGEFRSAGIKLENALKNIDEVESSAGITLTNYRAWLMDLQAHVAELHVRARDMRDIIEKRPDEPVASVRQTHRLQYEITARLLGDELAATLKQWHDTYESFLALYTDRSIRRTKRLERFNDLFRAMFIDRHPAYPLYRHWFNVTEQSPEFPPPPTDEPLPRLDEGVVEVSPIRVRDDSASPPIGKWRGRWWLGAGIIGVIGVIGVIAFAALNNDTAPLIAITITDTPTTTATLPQPSPSITSEVGALAMDVTRQSISLSPFVTPTAPPSATPTTPPPSPTPSHTPTPTLTLTPSHTPTPTITLTPSHTPTITSTPTATLPPEGIRGAQDLLALLGGQNNLPWDDDVFALSAEGAYWRLGRGTTGVSDTLRIMPPADLLERAYGNNAATRIRRVEANLTLLTYNPALVSADDVYFGLLLESSEDGNNVGLLVQSAQPTVINIAQVINNAQNFISQRAVNAVTVRLRIDRDVTSGSILLFLNDGQIGSAIPFVAADAPVLPVLLVKDGGVIIGVTDWQITLR